MKMPERDTWIRLGYTALGSGVAYAWHRYLPYKASNSVMLPPIALSTVLLASENVGDTEKDLAALAIGYMCVAQAVSYAQISSEDTTPTHQNPKDSTELSAQANKLQKIREVTGTLGALANLVGQFRGNN